MKATARKLLALIMAMAMCLSLLQGVAFAAESSEETPEAEPEVVEIVEDEKEEKKDVETQDEAAVDVTYVTALKAEEDGFTMQTEVWNNGVIKTPAAWGAKIAWSKAADYAKFVTVTTAEKAGSGLVGTIRKNKEYTVTALASVTKTGANVAKASVVVADDKDDLVKLTDADIDAKFVEMTSSQSYLETPAGSGNIREWKGYIYQELQDDGSYIAYFKLYPVLNDGTDDYFNTAADHEWYYAKKAAPTKLSGAGIATALSTADIVEATGKTAADDAPAFTKFYKGYTDPNPTLATVTVGTITAVGTITTFDYADPDDNTDVTTNPLQPELLDVTRNGSFKVRVTNTTGGSETYETSAEKVKAAMTEVGTGALNPWQVVSISDTATNDYWTVTIERIEPTVPDGNDRIDITNTTVYPYMFNENGATLYIRKVGLTDTANDGSYYKNAADQAAVPDRKSGISAGEILWGPVMVTKVPTDHSLDAINGVVYATVDNMLAAAAAANTDCSATKSIEYKQLALNLKVNGKDNLSAADIASLSSRANYTANAGGIFARTGALEPVTRTLTATAPKGDQHIRVKEVERTEPTCQKKGVKVTKVVCKKCGEIFSTNSVDLPIITKAADKDSKDNNYVLAGPTTPAPFHYISRFETTKVEPTKDSKGSITYTYYCNLGEHHAELDRTEELGKVVLEHSGKWNIVNWGDQNPQSVRSPAALFGFTPIVYDSDIDNEAVLIDSDTDASGTFTDEYFRFTAAGKRLDGIYESVATDTFTVVSYDANGKKVKNNKEYAARVTVTDINKADKECHDGSAKMTFEVYEFNGATDLRDAAGNWVLWDSQDNWLLTNPVATYTKEIVIPAEKTHNYLTKTVTEDGKTYTVNYCTICGEIDAESKTLIDGEFVPGSVDISGATIEGSEAYRGEYFNVAFTVTLDGKTLQEGIDFVVTNPRKNNFKGVGSHKITIAGIGEYSGTAVGYVWITETSQKVTVSPTKTTLKVKALKKKAISFKIDVKGAKGAVSFSSNNKKVTVSKAGKVTVKKGTKKGTYKVTVKVAKNGGFKAVTKTVTITVK